MHKIIIEDREFINELEALQYDVQSRQSILAYMIEMDNNIQSNSFKEYAKEYQDIYIKYQMKKKELENLYIRPKILNPNKWNLDFYTGELTIE